MLVGGGDRTATFVTEDGQEMTIDFSKARSNAMRLPTGGEFTFVTEDGQEMTIDLSKARSNMPRLGGESNEFGVPLSVVKMYEEMQTPLVVMVLSAQ